MVSLLITKPLFFQEYRAAAACRKHNSKSSLFAQVKMRFQLDGKPEYKVWRS